MRFDTQIAVGREPVTGIVAGNRVPIGLKPRPDDADELLR